MDKELTRLDIKIVHRQKQSEDLAAEMVFVWEVGWTDKGRWAQEFDKFDDAVNFAKRLGAK